MTLKYCVVKSFRCSLMLTNSWKLLVEITFAFVAIKFIGLKTKDRLSITKWLMTYLSNKTRFLTQPSSVAMNAACDVAIIHIQYEWVITTDFFDRKAGQI